MTEPSPAPLSVSQATVSTSRSLRARLMLALRLLAAVNAIATCLLGVALQLIIRDQYLRITSILYYAMPRPLLALTATFAVMVCPRPFKTCRWMAIVLAVGLWGSALRYDVAWNLSRSSESATLRIAVWNAANLGSGRSAAAAEVASWNCDIIGIVEAGDTQAADLEMWKTLLPDYEFQTNRSGMLFVSRRPLTLQPAMRLGPRSDAIRADFEHEGRTCSVWLIDIASNVTLPRRLLLERLTAEVRSSRDRPQILLGDFNTPPGSVWLRDLRKDYQQTHETAGLGYAPTWPVPCPVLTLDMIWVNRDWSVATCDLGWTGSSDHRPVVAALTIATVATELQ